jgi:hypothetical protein
MPPLRLSISCAVLVVAFLAAPHASALERGMPYAEALSYAKDKGWMTPSPDGDMRSDRILTKAEFLKVVLPASGNAEAMSKCRPSRGDRLKDVPADAWYARAVCAALRVGIVARPKDGLMNPGKKVTFAEAAKMLSSALDSVKPEETRTWYEPYVKHLTDLGAVPDSIVSHTSYVSRGELAEMLWRIKEGKTGLASANADQILNGTCTWFEEKQIPGVDLQEVKRVWLSWYNDVRGQLNLQPLSYDKQLTRTASLWSSQAAAAGSITHKRSGQTAYYDYARMTDWFSDYQITFANVDRITFTENIGWGVFKCPANADCTETFIKAVRSTFDFYMAEKGKPSSAHYNSIVNPHFQKLGLGIVTQGNRYYLTAHYGTEITSKPEPVCP